MNYQLVAFGTYLYKRDNVIGLNLDFIFPNPTSIFVILATQLIRKRYIARNKRYTVDKKRYTIGKKKYITENKGYTAGRKMYTVEQKDTLL